MERSSTVPAAAAREGAVGEDDGTVVKFRLEHGLCHRCGTQIYERKEQGRIEPLTIEGVVKRGRCLFCYPDPNNKDATAPKQKQQEEGAIAKQQQPQEQELPEKEDVQRQEPPQQLLPLPPLPQPQQVVAAAVATATLVMDETPPPAPTKAPTSSTSQTTTNARSAAVCSPETPASTAKSHLFRPQQQQEQVDSGAEPEYEPVEEVCEDDDKEKSLYPDFDSSRKTRQQRKRTGLLDGEGPTLRKSKRIRHSSKVVSLDQGKSDSSLKDNYKTDSPSHDEAGRADGKVQIRDADGTIFEGHVMEGTATKGKGFFTHVHKEPAWASKVATYTGEFANGTMEGQGKQVDAAGCVYEGSFKAGAANGKGRCEWPVGWVYEGEWENDLRSGTGTCRQSKDGGEVYSGEWRNDMWHGRGELRFALGDKYTGEFAENKIHGQGQYDFSDGSIYKGSFENDFRSGEGKMHYSDGQVYTGSWKNNWRDGRGELTFPDGSVFRGTFRADEMHTGFIYMQDGIVRQVKNGRVQS